jgi:hypothetical protein
MMGGQAQTRWEPLSVDSATAGLIGAGIGGGLSLATALLTPWVTVRLSRQQFAREAEQRKLADLQSVADDAGLALETVHWAAHDALRRVALGSSPDPALMEEWREACSKMAAAQADASRQGTRLAIRLGAPRGGVSSPCVAAYDELQDRYRGIVREIQGASGGEADLRSLGDRLDRLGDHQTYLNQASLLLKPKAI